MAVELALALEFALHHIEIMLFVRVAFVVRSRLFSAEGHADGVVGVSAITVDFSSGGLRLLGEAKVITERVTIIINSNTLFCLRFGLMIWNELVVLFGAYVRHPRPRRPGASRHLLFVEGSGSSLFLILLAGWRFAQHLHRSPPVIQHFELRLVGTQQIRFPEIQRLLLVVSTLVIPVGQFLKLIHFLISCFLLLRTVLDGISKGVNLLILCISLFDHLPVRGCHPRDLSSVLALTEFHATGGRVGPIPFLVHAFPVSFEGRYTGHLFRRRNDRLLELFH